MGLWVACSPSANPAGNPITLTISAAADLAFAFQELGKAFEEETGVKVVFNFGSTGKLAQQIERGAAVDLLAAANRDAVEELERQGLIMPDTKALYGRGFITLWTPAHSPLRLHRIEDLMQREVRRIAIANPEHAPYGMAAREALQSAGLWERVRPKLVMGENVRQALQYAETGNVEVAIVALSLSMQGEGRWVLIPESLYHPLDQVLAIPRGTKHEPEARAFAAFVNGPRGRTIMNRYGFLLPGEGSNR